MNLPFPGFHTLENNIGWYFQDYHSKKHQLVAQVHGILVHVDILGKSICQRAREVHTI